MEYVLKKKRDPDNRFDTTYVIHVIETENLEDLLDGFTEFLKGCGFSIKGRIGILDEEE